MNNQQKKELISYLRASLAQADARLRTNIVDATGNPYPKRKDFAIFKKYIHHYLIDDGEPRWIVMPGLRGVGKTTLLSQLFLEILTTSPQIHKLYLSIDEPVRRFNASLWDIIEVYETLLGTRLEQFNTKAFLFLDEVHYDNKWDAAIKTFYDRSKKIFILCTGSSSALLKKQINTDSARRAYFRELYPMDFTEYAALKLGISLDSTLRKAIHHALFNAHTANEACAQIASLTKKIQSYWMQIDVLEIQRFMTFGTMPFSLSIQGDGIIHNQLRQILQKIIYTDIGQLSAFEQETLNKLYALIYLLADSFEISLTRLAEHVNVSKDTLSLMLRALENTGIIQKIAPHGSHYKQTRKPYKYLFTSPAFRFTLLESKDSISAFNTFKGKLLEDVVGLYLQRILSDYANTSITYDPAQAGADFIIRIGDKKIVIEAGYGKKSRIQALFTLKRVQGDYGIVISQNQEPSVHNNILKLPLEYFLLL